MREAVEEVVIMNVRAWESFVDKLLVIGVNSVQGLIRIAIIVAVAYFVTRLLRSGLNRLEALLIRATQSTETTPGAAAKRIRTLMSVLWTISSGLLWFIVVLVAFSQVGLNIGPILAGAGVVGLAVGFGAQHLVRDLVSGFFILLENQIRVGDIAIINGRTGSVESITFRTVVLRDQAGVVHVFPNGTINTLANATLDWSADVVDVTLPYWVDTDRVMEILRRVGAEMKAEKEFASVMLEPIEVFGVDNFTEALVTIKVRFKTLPGRQSMVGREFRRRLKYALAANGIVISSPPSGANEKPAAAPSPPS
jgi:moderate conductance mechanosensitive channel